MGISEPVTAPTNVGVGAASPLSIRNTLKADLSLGGSYTSSPLLEAVKIACNAAGIRMVIWQWSDVSQKWIPLSIEFACQQICDPWRGKWICPTSFVQPYTTFRQQKSPRNDGRTFPH